MKFKFKCVPPRYDEYTIRCRDLYYFMGPRIDGTRVVYGQPMYSNNDADVFWSEFTNLEYVGR